MKADLSPADRKNLIVYRLGRAKETIEEAVYMLKVGIITPLSTGFITPHIMLFPLF